MSRARLTRSVRAVYRRVTAVPFAVMFAVLGINQAVTFFINPRSQPAGLLASPLDYVWIGMYGTGGALILAGTVSAMANLEAAGCIAFGGGALIAALATAVVVGWPAWNTVLILVMFCVAALIRAQHLVRGQVLVLVDTEAGSTVRGGYRR